MGCFGDMTPTQTVNTSSVTKIPKWASEAGQQNYEDARAYYDAGYTPYEGQRVAELSPNEQMAGSMVRDAASTGNPPISARPRTLFAPGGSVSV